MITKGKKKKKPQCQRQEMVISNYFYYFKLFYKDYSQIKKQIVQLKQTLNQSTINSKQIDSAIKEKQNEINNVILIKNFKIF